MFITINIIGIVNNINGTDEVWKERMIGVNTDLITLIEEVKEENSDLQKQAWEHGAKSAVSIKDSKWLWLSDSSVENLVRVCNG